MKKAKRILSIFVILTLSLVFFACSDESNDPRCQDGHTYDNACDIKCNICNQSRQKTEHIYENDCDSDCNECGEVRTAVPHAYDNGCDAICNVCGEERVPWQHVYDNDCDAVCNKCGEERTPDEHSYFSACDSDCNECGEIRAAESHTDTDKDGKCDKCRHNMPKSLKLFEGGLPNFNFILSKTLSADIRRILEFDIYRKLYAMGIDVSIITEDRSNDTETDMEILIGDVKNRGEKYDYDERTLGKEGYIIDIIGSKVIITAGSDATLANTVVNFANDVIGINGDDVYEVTMTDDDCVEHVQSDFELYIVSIAGIDIGSYTIVADPLNAEHMASAKLLQETLYHKSGIYLDIKEPGDSGYQIIFRSIPKTAGEDSFKIFTEEKNLVIECAYDNMMETAFGKFLSKISEAEGTLRFPAGTLYKQDISVIYYEDFGAKGDGVTDDFEAIYNAHVQANKGGQTVKGRAGAVYYIFDSKNRTIPIKTNVDFCGAEFIIDDREIGSFTGNRYNTLADYNIFTVQRSEQYISVTDKTIINAIFSAGLNPGTKKIDLSALGIEGAALIVPYNSSHKVFRRRGYSNYAGDSMNEVIVIDEYGNVSAETPILYHYSKITSLYIYPMDEADAITVENATFTTRASQLNTKGKSDGYIKRGISVVRSYTTLKNIKHYITDEIPLHEQVDAAGNIIVYGAIYSGFFNISNANHVTVEDCVLTGRRCYDRAEGGADGTYDLSAKRVNKLVFKNCTQSNFWVTVDEDLNIHPATEDTPGALLSMEDYVVNGNPLKMHWGIGGTNYCKNVEYIGSTLSRLDAHAGLYNGKVIDSTVNFLSLTGGGEFVIENSKWYAAGTSYTNNSIIYLRNDYGSTWNGSITIKNLKAYTHTSNTSYVMYHSYNNWYYGYTCHFPNLSIDNLDFYDIRTGLALEAGYQIKLTGTSISKTSKRHLEMSHTAPYFAVVDADKDGFVDEPKIDQDLDGIVDTDLDLDGDGKIGNTSIEYATATKSNSGIKHTGTYVNLNIVVPPEYIKITGNDGVDGKGGYVYIITNTSGAGVSDGGYYDSEESYGGFFGDTKFYYSDTEYFVGSNHPEQTETETLKFQ